MKPTPGGRLSHAAVIRGSILALAVSSTLLAGTARAVDPSIAPRLDLPPRTLTLTAARARLGANTTVRLAGAFGTFRGRVADYGGEALTGLTPLDAGATAPERIAWADIQSVDTRVSNAGRGAKIGGALGGALGAAMLVTVAGGLGGMWGGSASGSEIAGAAFVGVLLGGGAGAGTGALIGAASYRWEPVYRR